MKLRLSSSDLGCFFYDRHHELARKLVRIAPTIERHESSGALGDPEHQRALAREMGAVHGLYEHLVPTPGQEPPHGPGPLDVRALCLVREMLGYSCATADSIFAVQGLGTFPIVVAGTPQQRADRLPRAITGARIAAFALTEPNAGSDVGAISTSARLDDDGAHWVIEGAKTFISNAGIAAHYIVFARTGWDEARQRARLSAFIVDAETPGLYVAPLPMSVDHPIGTVRFAGCRVPATALLGRPGDGYALAMRTLDTFRITVGAAAVGMARRALDESLRRVRERSQFGKPIAEFQTIQGYLAEMATELDASRLLVYRAAWLKDAGAPGETARAHATAEVAMAKMYATEAAQRIIDRAVQIFGGLGVTRGNTVERLYREIRPLRIYEGTTEIQRMIIARALLARAADDGRDGHASGPSEPGEGRGGGES